jgi:hypothetical protein
MNDTYSESRTLTEQWLLAEFEGQDLSERADQAVQNSSMGAFWPFLNDYYSPYNPVFSPLFTSYLRNHRESRIWLRDGIVPLSWSLRKYRPEDVAGTLLVNERLAPFIPEEWRSRISLYRLHARKVKNPDTLVIAGPVSERVCSLEEIDDRLDRALDVLGRRELNVKLFCPIRGDGEKFPAEFFRRVYSRFPKTEAVDWHALVNSRSLENTLYMELNGDWIYADSFVQQTVLGRGAGLLFDREPARSSRLLPLSRFHCAEISALNKVKFVNWDEAAFKYCRQAAELNGQTAEESLWPSWYESGCHALK